MKGTRVAVLGAGASGLAAARLLMQAGADVAVFEAEGVAGGKIRTDEVDGYLCEAGPNTLVAQSPTALRLAAELGLAVVEVSAPRTRFVALNGRAHRAPSPGLLSPAGWARVLAEPVLMALGGRTGRRTSRRSSGDPGVLAKPTPRVETDDESLRDFLVRHVGPEAGVLGATLLASGVYAGDPAGLSASAAFPRLAALGMGTSSLILNGLRGARPKRARDPSTPRTLFSFQDGLASLARAMAKDLGPRLHLGVTVEGVARRPQGGFSVRVKAKPSEAPTDAVVCALPARAASRVLAGLSPAAAELANVPYAPIAVVHLGYQADALERPARGFGVLDGDGTLGPLGILFPSSLFVGRAPDGQVLFTCLLGGTLQPDVIDFEDGALAYLAERAVARLFGTSRPPGFRRVVRWHEAVPQPVIGLKARLARVREDLEAVSGGVGGLALAGALWEGVSVEAALQSGEAAAKRVLASMKTVILPRAVGS